MYRRLAPALLLAALLAASPALAAPHASSPTAVVKLLVANVNAHRLSQTGSMYTPQAVMRVNRATLRGRSAIERWWKLQFALGARISNWRVARQRGNEVQGPIRLQAKRGGCANGCWYAGAWQLNGNWIVRMTLQALPTPRAPAPPVTVPPLKTPPPHVTPTIPTSVGAGTSRAQILPKR